LRTSENYPSTRSGEYGTKLGRGYQLASAESVGDGGGVRVLLEPRDLPVAHAKHVGEVALPLPAGGLDVPRVVAQRHDLLALGDEFFGLEVPRLLGIAQTGEEPPRFFDAMVGAANRYPAQLDGHPFYVLGERGQDALYKPTHKVRDTWAY
jgi:hypothetical protein